MLTAQNERGAVIDISGMSKQAIEQLRDIRWYCCVCHHPVVLKNGRVMISHFAHKQLSSCQAFSEGETAEHLCGKALLAAACRRWGYPFQLEAYLPSLKQRPDILIADHWAVEFQCSPLPVKRLVERTEAYRQNGYTVVWLTGRNLWLKHRLSALQRALVYFSKQLGFHMWELDVANKTVRLDFFIEQLICETACRYSQREWPAADTPLAQILNYPETASLSVKRTYHAQNIILRKRQQLAGLLANKNPKAAALQTYLYEQRLNLQTLPDYYFTPVSDFLFFKSDSVLVKRYVWEILAAHPGGLSRTAVVRLLDERLSPADWWEMPNIDRDVLLHFFVWRYLSLVKKTGFGSSPPHSREISMIPVKYDMIMG